VTGDAGLIAVDADGNVAMPFNTRVMHRAVKIEGSEIRTAVMA
jgi:isoaspartyl peptidase/L-asparaginase-like protein (Ntn-hydrolase superfamily)